MRDIYGIHKGMVVCDTHCDTVGRMLNGTDIGIRADVGHIDIPRLVEGGVDVQVFACCIGSSGKPDGYYSGLANRMIDALHSQFDKHSKLIEVALTLSDIERINRNGKIAAIIAIEGGQAIENDLARLEKFYDMGVRLMTITWQSTDWADASQQTMKHNGLTEFGKDVISEMNRLGMIIDVSHSADKTVWDVLEVSEYPIIASHSCAKALCNHPRNVNDKLIKALAKSGGVICINFYSAFLDQGYRSLRREGLKPKPPPMDRVIDHIEYIAKLGGTNSVGLGSDFDGMNPPPMGLEDASKMPGITELLMERGYLEEEITKIVGGNFLSVFGHVCGI